MQKKLFIIAAYFIVSAVCANAQQKKQDPAPPPPPPPPVIENVVIAPPPPVPPTPAIAPAYSSPVLVNSNGYDISVKVVNGEEMIFLEKNNVKQKIKMSTWNANRKFYEKKYGQLPLAIEITPDTQ